MRLVDGHCHPLSLTHVPLDPAALTLAVDETAGAEERRRRVSPHRVVEELLTVRLARHFDCAPDEVPAAREASAADWPAYVRSLFDDAEIAALVWDPATTPGAADRMEEHAELVQRPVHPLYRIDPLVDRLIAEGARTGEIAQAVAESLQQAQREDGAVGGKTIIAYRTGLAVQAGATEDEADESLREAALPVRRRGAACRALVLRRALGVAAELGMPFQIHTGFGDAEIRLGESNPLLLEPLLDTREGTAARLVLLHTSYPFNEEAAYLAATRPNVFCDLSLASIFAPLTYADRLARMLELAPSTKLLFGTDAWQAPEGYWFAVHVIRQAWRDVARRLSEQGVRRSWLERAEQRLFARNAIDLYGIADPVSPASEDRA